MRRLPRAAACLLASVLSPAIASAQDRPDTEAMTCAEAAALVARSGAVVLSSGPMIYGRVVRDGGFCPVELTARPDFRPTRDERNCFVGYRCTDYEGRGNQDK